MGLAWWETGSRTAHVLSTYLDADSKPGSGQLRPSPDFCFLPSSAHVRNERQMHPKGNSGLFIAKLKWQLRKQGNPLKALL